MNQRFLYGQPLGSILKRVIFHSLFLSFLYISSTAFALNDASLLLLDRLFEAGRKATHDELIEMLVPVVADEQLSHMKKKKEMAYLVYISGWELSKSDKNTLYDEAYRVFEKQRKKNYLETHTDLDPKIREAIKAGRVVVGMTQESVQASLGKPEEVKPAIGTFMNTERWYYFTKRKVLFFKDGLLSSLKAQ